MFTQPSPALHPNIRIGTCSWKYDSWKGLVYTDDVGKNYLKQYSRKYEIVEVDQWFWSLFNDKVVMPKPEIVADYVSSVPKEFRFSIKVPNSITLTHHPQKRKSDELEVNPHFLSDKLMHHFLESVQPMDRQINSLIFQFGYLNRHKMPSHKAFLEQLELFFKRLPPRYNYCIEIRNPNYLNERHFKFLHAMNLSHVFLQGYWMPPVFNLYDTF